MKIPNNTLRTSHLRSYGISDLPGDVELHWAGCPAVYKATYVDRTLVEPEGYNLAYGSLVHDALYIAEEEGLPILPDALEKAWSIHTQHGPEGEERMLPLGPEAFQEAVDDLTAYIERGGLNLATIAVEQELTMPLLEVDGVEYQFGGRLDWIGIDPNEPNVLYYADYKTNRSPPSQADLDKDAQFTGYALLVRANIEKYMPGVDPDDVRIIGIMEAVKWYQLTTIRMPWQLESFEDWLRAMARRILSDETGDPVLNVGCGQCPLKFDCPVFMSMPGEGATIQDRMSMATDLEDRVEFMQQAEVTVKVLKDSIDAVKEELKETLVDQTLAVGGKVYSTGEAWATEMDTQALFDLLGPQEFLSLSSITDKALKEVVRRRPELRSGIEACKRKYVKGRRLKIGQEGDGSDA